jgi:hypothetical protein
MKKLLKFAVCLALLVLVVVLFTGCKVTGGGSFMSCENKVTFGFNAQGKETDGVWDFKGQFQAVNHGEKQKIHINEMILVTVDGPVADFMGLDKDGSVVNVTVTDLGEPGPGPDDLILIISKHGIWGGVVQGEIQIHKEK